MSAELKITALTVLLGLGTGHGVAAESDESMQTADSQPTVYDASHYAMPDVSDAWLKSLTIASPNDSYQVNWGFALLPADYTTFTQDSASKRQVGAQDDSYQVRSLRFMSYGYFQLLRHWSYMVSYEYKGFDQIPDTANWQPADIKISTQFDGVGTLSFGKIKEPYIYEMVGDSANLPQSERLLNPFFKSRNVGVQLTNTMFDTRATWAIGVYDNWLTTNSRLSQAGKDVAARVTALPIANTDGTEYLHLGVSVRYVGADDGQLRFKGPPSSNVAGNYVDTGAMVASHAWNTGLEALWNVGPYSLLAEYVTSSVSSASSGDPTFSGYYLTGSWVLTGENRPYDRKAAYARRIMPTGRWGAVELMARYGRVSLDDAAVHGGTLHGGWVGANWWATRRWKFSVMAGDIDLDRFGLRGDTKEVLWRMQWIY